VNIIPEQTCTGFHLRDIFDSTKKLHEIKSKLYEMILFNKRFPKTLEKSTRVQTEDEDIGFKVVDEDPRIDFDLEQFLKENDCADGIKKLQKEDIFDPVLFFKLEIGTIESTLDIKP